MDKDFENAVRIAVDAYCGRGDVKKFSSKDSMDVIREELIKMNGGSTKMSYSDIRSGKCEAMFAYIEQVLRRTIPEGLQGDEAFNRLVEFHDVSAGDAMEFTVEDSNLFFVSEAADGTQGIRRQRLDGSSKVIVPTTIKAAKIYEELGRVLAGKVDFNQLIDKVKESFQVKLRNDVYSIWSTVSADQLGGATYFPSAGSYDEDALLELIAHVEAAAGQKATLLGTKRALRHLKPSIDSDGYKNDMYTMGYCGKFYGNEVVEMPQRHKVNSTEFVIPDDEITVIAGDAKPIKCVYEGVGTIILGNPMSNADMTQEYMYAEKYGLAVATAGNGGVGRYKIAA